MSFHHHILSTGAVDAIFTVPIAATVIVVSSLLGIIWAIVNYVSIRRIDLSYPATRPLGITQDQHIRLIELGDKIAMVLNTHNPGSQRIPYARIPCLPHIRGHHVRRHLCRSGANANCLHCFRISFGRPDVYGVRCHRYDDCHLYQLQGNLLRKKFACLRLHYSISWRLCHGIRPSFNRTLK
jgi:hypothetical protein